jgi:membrane-bound serine protease (ClpP class)
MGRASRFFSVLRAAYLGSIALGVVLLVLGSAFAPGVARAAESPAVATSPAAQDGTGFVYVATFRLPITPISAQYLERLIKNAEDDGASALVLELDTPGGLVDSMQVMVQRILASRVPVIAYVAPQGAMATSAGVFVVYASHLAVMAPNTTIGSSEVIINAGGGEEGTPTTGDDEAMRRKVTNLLVSQIRSLAEQRGRNADFAEKAVTESANLNAQGAIEQKVVDFGATDVADLLRQADGRTVKLASGDYTLRTDGAVQRTLEPTLAEDLMFLITNPSVAFLLISLGTLGITWEFINPGSVFPGVVGAICLLTGLLGLGTLPVNWGGAVFLVLAFALFIADVFMPSHGILTAGGVVSLVIGGLLLINTGAAPGIPGVSPAVVLGTATGFGAFFFFSVYKIYKARKTRPSTGRESLAGRLAYARTDIAPDGMVFVEGELWHAYTEDGSILSGQPVRVVATEGLKLRVKPEPAAGNGRAPGVEVAAATPGEGVDTRKL